MAATLQIKSGAETAGRPVSQIINSICMAACGFMTVILLYQLFIGTLSHALGYQTQITFGQVISKPYGYRYWGSSRVLLMYAAPSLILLVITVYMVFRIRFLWGRRYLYFFWITVWGILLVTCQLTTAPLASLLSKGPLYQGLAVVANWWGLGVAPLLALAVAAVLLNIFFGFALFPAVMRMSSRGWQKLSPRHQQHIVLTHFIVPLTALVPLAVLLSFPSSVAFFAFMFAQVLFWLPGLLLPRYGRVNIESIFPNGEGPALSRIVAAGLIVLIVLVRIFM